MSDHERDFGISKDECGVCSPKEDEVSERNVVVNAIAQAIVDAVDNHRDVMANGKLHRIASADCPVRAVRAYFVRAMDEAIEGATRVTL